MDIKNVIYIIIFLILIYLIDKEIFSPRSLVVYLFFIILWNLSHKTVLNKNNTDCNNESFNDLKYIGNMKQYNPFNYYYDNTDKTFTSNNYYNIPNCTLQRNRNESCIIPPDTTNQFTDPNLKNLVKETNTQYIPNQEIITYPNCNTNQLITKNRESFSNITPNIPDETVIQEGRRCRFYNQMTNSPGIYAKPPKGCCPQGYKYDRNKRRCKQFCRGCQTGTCRKGWCFSESSCQQNNL